MPMETSVLSLILLVLLAAIISCLEASHQTYNTYYVEDQCINGNETIIYEIHSTRAGSSAILQGRRKGGSPMNSNCTLIVRAPTGYGVILDVEEVDFNRSPFSRRCTEFIRIFSTPIRPTTLCSLSYKNEEISFWIQSEIRLLYHTISTGKTVENSVGFRLTLTAYTRDVRMCDAKDKFLCLNGNCIWNGLTCDGHDNCGDQSDEHDLGCETLPDTVVYEVIYIVSGCLVVFIAMTCGIAFCCRHKKTQRKVVGGPYLVPQANPYEAIHPSGEFICQDPAGPRTPYPSHHPILLNGEGGFSNPCYPHGVPHNMNPSIMK